MEHSSSESLTGGNRTRAACYGAGAQCRAIDCAYIAQSKPAYVMSGTNEEISDK
jgi:hypothetical protein